MTDSKVVVIIAAAGKGLRMKSDTPKQYLPILGIPVLSHTLLNFEKINAVDEIILAVPEDDFERCKRKIIEPFGFKKTIHLVAGGISRNDSVFNCLEFLNLSVINARKTLVLIHDGVRPLVNETIIHKAIDQARHLGAAIPVMPVTDTLKKSADNQTIIETIERKGLYLAQTPQAFRFDIIFNAYRFTRNHHLSGTDDAELVEQAGIDVYRFDGSMRNIKITTPEDMELAAFYLGSR